MNKFVLITTKYTPLDSSLSKKADSVLRLLQSMYGVSHTYSVASGNYRTYIITSEPTTRETAHNLFMSMFVDRETEVSQVPRPEGFEEIQIDELTKFLFNYF